jgi:hypothetical protein
VREEHVQVVACQCCHEYIVTAPRAETILDRGILGDELIVQATVDHYQDGVPWERMQTRARERGVPLSANTLAQASGRAIDLLDPIVRHIFHKAVSSKYFGFAATALPGLELFARIFHVDAESKRAGETLEQRFARRQRDSAPIVAELKAWVDARRADVEPKSVLGSAVQYIDRQWRRLTEFMRDSRMELTNNEVERDLRTWVLDRKTWMFCGHDLSAQRAAAALSAITACKKMNIDPVRYIRDTLRRILGGEKDLNALLPENYKPDLATRDQEPMAA